MLGVRQPQTVVRAALLALFAGDQPPRCSFAGRARSGRGGRIRARRGREVPDRPPKRYSSELGHAARASPARIAQNRSFVSVRAREDCTKLPILCQFAASRGRVWPGERSAALYTQSAEPPAPRSERGRRRGQWRERRRRRQRSAAPEQRLRSDLLSPAPLTAQRAQVRAALVML